MCMLYQRQDVLEASLLERGCARSRLFQRENVLEAGFTKGACTRKGFTRGWLC